MTSLMMSYGFLLCLCDYLRFTLKSADNSIHSIKEILSVDSLLVMSCCSKSCLITYICYICS